MAWLFRPRPEVFEMGADPRAIGTALDRPLQQPIAIILPALVCVRAVVVYRVVEAGQGQALRTQASVSVLNLARISAAYRTRDHLVCETARADLEHLGHLGHCHLLLMLWTVRHHGVCVQPGSCYPPHCAQDSAQLIPQAAPEPSSHEARGGNLGPHNAPMNPASPVSTTTAPTKLSGYTVNASAWIADIHARVARPLNGRPFSLPSSLQKATHATRCLVSTSKNDVNPGTCSIQPPTALCSTSRSGAAVKCVTDTLSGSITVIVPRITPPRRVVAHDRPRGHR